MNKKVTVVEIEHDYARVDLLTESAVDPRIEVVRADEGTFIGRNGLIQSAAANTLRKQFRFDGTFDRYLFERASENLLVRSEPDASLPTGWTAPVDSGTFTRTLESHLGLNAVDITQTASGRSFIRENLTLVTNTDYVLSIWFDMDNTSVSSGNTVIARATAFGATVNGDISDLDENGRMVLTFNTGADAVGLVDIGIGTQGDAVGQTRFTGWQLEEGTRPTSLIITGDTTQTRGAEKGLFDGADFTSLGIDDGGTLVCEFIANSTDGNSTPVSISDGTTNNRIRIGDVGGQHAGFGTEGGVTQWNGSGGTFTVGTTHRQALSFAENDISFFADGNQIFTDSSATLPTVDRLEIGTGPAAGQGDYGIRFLVLYSDRRTNSETQTRSEVGWTNTITKIGQTALGDGITPRLVRSPEYRVKVGSWIWETETISGVGNIEALSLDGRLDYLLAQVIRDKPVRIKTGTRSTNLETVAMLKGDYVRANNNHNLDIAFAPLDVILQETLQDKFYDSSAPNSELDGNPFPINIGTTFQVPALLYDGSVPEYHTSDNAFTNEADGIFANSGIKSVQSNGNPANTSQFSAIEFGFDMSVSPAGKVTANLGPDYSWADGVKEILLEPDADEAFLTAPKKPRRGKFTNIDQDELDALATEIAFGTTTRVGYFTTAPVRTGVALQKFFDPVLAWFFIDPNGQMRFGRLQDPSEISGDPVLTITKSNILEGSAIEIQDDLMPGLTDTVGARKNWFPISESENVAGELTLQEKAQVGSEFRFIAKPTLSDLDPFYQWAHRVRVLDTIDTSTGFWTVEIQKNIASIASKRRRMYTIRAPIPDPPELLPGQKINVAWPGKGLDGGKDLVLLGFRRRFTEQLIELEAWG